MENETKTIITPAFDTASESWIAHFEKHFNCTVTTKFLEDYKCWGYYLQDLDRPDKENHIFSVCEGSPDFNNKVWNLLSAVFSTMTFGRL